MTNEDSTGSIPDPEVDEVVESKIAQPNIATERVSEVLRRMGDVYRDKPDISVRNQEFIKILHEHVGKQLEARLTKFAKRRKIKIVYEAKVLGSTKPKKVDVAVVDPDNGPLMIIGVRSQMSSVGNNVLGYYEGIVGECISLQDRFPMSTHGWVYLHPLTSIKGGKEKEPINHSRYARMYEAVTGRAGPGYKNLRGIFDEFAYLVVDFEQSPPELCDEIVRDAVPDVDLSIDTFVERIIGTFNKRTLFWDVFG